MPNISISQFASELKMPAIALLEQLQKAGVSKHAVSDTVTEQDKSRLLDHLRKSRGEKVSNAKVRLKRKQTIEIKSTDSYGNARTTLVGVGKKRIFVKLESSDTIAERSTPTVLIDENKPTEPLATDSQTAGEASQTIEKFILGESKDAREVRQMLLYRNDPWQWMLPQRWYKMTARQRAELRLLAREWVPKAANWLDILGAKPSAYMLGQKNLAPRPARETPKIQSKPETGHSLGVGAGKAVPSKTEQDKKTR